MSVATARLPDPLAAATRHQPRARSELGSALVSGPTHAYLLRGPRGSGKAAAARAFAAELLADGSPEPEQARRRVLLDPSPHPDLVWLRPPGAQHLVEEVREMVIRAASLRPMEGERRVFVIEEAEALRDESQNALLKTLEEPAPFAHMVLLCSDPELLLPTIVSRCRPVDFGPLSPEAVIERLGESGESAEAASRLCGGDAQLAGFLLSDEGRELRAGAEAAARAALEPGSERPWGAMLDRAEGIGREAGASEERRLAELAETGGRRGRSGKLTREAADQVKRTERRARTRALELGLALCGAWYRDLAAVAGGAENLILNSDRSPALAEDAARTDSRRANEAAALVLDTRRRLRINVSEELALEALWLRLADALRA